MFRKIVLPILAGLGVVFALIMVAVGQEKPPLPPIEFPPPKPPYKHFIAGSGVLEASSENILIGAPYPEILAAIHVHAGDRIKQGAPLFSLDTSKLLQEKREKEGALQAAVNEYAKLVHEPRKEEVPPAIATMEAAKAEYENELDQYNIVMAVADRRALSENTRRIRRHTLAAAKGRYDEAKGNLELLMSGAWLRDLEIQKARIEEAEGALEVVTNEIRRATVRAPVDGQVLQVNGRIGEQTSEVVQSHPIMVFGSTETLYIRVDIDQDEAWRFEPNTKATAFVRGNSAISIPLKFVRYEPLVVPKRSYTGDAFERIDTRVLQVLYSFSPKDYPVYTGLILDVYIEAKPFK